VWLHQNYRLDVCDASVVVRVAADGSIADSQEDEQFQSSIGLHVNRDVASMQLGAADFVLTGHPKESFFGSLGVPNAIRTLAKMLATAEGFVLAFLTSAKKSSYVIRVQRSSGRESYLIYLKGVLAGQSTQCFLTGDFAVSDAYEADTETLAACRFVESGDLVSGGSQTAAYFFTLMANLQRWRATFVT
jgi:hypothetical protein